MSMHAHARWICIAVLTTGIAILAGALIYTDSDATDTDFIETKKRGWEYYNAGHYDRAYDTFASILERDPDNFYGLIGVGYMYYQNGSYAAARDAFASAGKVRPYNGEVYHGLGEAYLRMHEYKRAIAAFEHAEPLLQHKWEFMPPFHSGQDHMLTGMGWAYYQDGKISTAAEYMDKALKVSPHHTIPLILRTVIAHTQGSMDDAERYARTVLRVLHGEQDVYVGANRDERIMYTQFAACMRNKSETAAHIAECGEKTIYAGPIDTVESI